jgi:hypothetical protein
MIAAFALIQLAEAPANCALPGSDRLGGGAVLVRPGVTFEPMAVGPATGFDTNRGKIHLAQATAEGNQEADSGRPAEQCEADIIPIV